MIGKRHREPGSKLAHVTHLAPLLPDDVIGLYELPHRQLPLGPDLNVGLIFLNVKDGCKRPKTLFKVILGLVLVRLDWADLPLELASFARVASKGARA